MTRPRIFPEPADTESQSPKKKFEEVASNVFSVPKEEIDKREKEWEQQRKQLRPKKSR